MSLLAIMLMLSVLPAGAQAGKTPQAAQAILELGPVAVRGLPFFPPNVLEADRAEYLAGHSLIEVYITREPLVLPVDWRKASCGQEALLRVEGEDRPTYCFVEPGEGGFALFLAFESDDFPWCAWTRAFLPRLRSLLAFSRGPADAPFPAVLDY
jgi:hypothetical protein